MAHNYTKEEYKDSIENLPSIFSRNKGYPLDSNSIFDSLDEAKRYAEGKKSDGTGTPSNAYVGQYIAVKTAEATDEATAQYSGYIIADTNGTLKPTTYYAGSNITINDETGKISTTPNLTAEGAVIAKHLELNATNNETWGYIDFHSPSDSNGDNDGGRIYAAEGGIGINRDTRVEGKLTADKITPTIFWDTFIQGDHNENWGNALGSPEFQLEIVTSTGTRSGAAMLIKYQESEDAFDSPKMNIALDGSLWVNEGLEEVFHKAETGSSQGSLKINNADYSINGLSTTGTPTFASVSAASASIGSISGNTLELQYSDSHAPYIDFWNSSLDSNNDYTWRLTSTTTGLQLHGYNDIASGCFTAASFNAMSDARLKENFILLTSEKSILDLPTYKFDFINGAKNQIGCKAQDLQEICPEIVDEGSDGYLSIQESKIIYLLLEEVKKLRKEVDELRGE